MKTAIQWLENYLNQKVLPCPEGNDYVYGMNVAHENLINYVIPALKEKEKELIVKAVEDTRGNIVPRMFIEENLSGEEYYNQNYNQNK